MPSNAADVDQVALEWQREEQERQGRLSSLAFLRLRWEIREGPIKDLIYVLKDMRNSNSDQEPFFIASGFHEIADLPVTMKPMAKVQVALSMHRKPEPPFGESDTSSTDSSTLDPPQHAHGDGTPPLTITVSPGDKERDFVSIKDYILALHDWLVSWRSAILEQQSLHHSYRDIDSAPWPAGSRLWLDPMAVDYVYFFSDQDPNVEMSWFNVAFVGPADREPPRETRMVEKYVYEPVYPTELLPDSHFENSHHVRPSLPFLRLRWTIPIPKSDDGDSTTLTLSKSVSILEDVYDLRSPQVPFQDQNGQFHEIAALPFSRPPRRELEVTIDRMDGCQEWKLYTEEEADSPRVEDPESAPRITVRAGEGRDFISIGDYVTQVHPWLVALTPQMLKELGLTAGYTEW